MSRGSECVTKLLFSHYVIVIVSIFVIYGVVRVGERIISSKKRASLHLEVHTKTWAHRRGLGPAGAQGLGLAIAKNSVTGAKANDALAGRAPRRIDTKVVTWHHREAQLETLGD